MKNNNEKLRKLVFTSLFSALCTVATMIAFPAGPGYINAGDMMVLLGAFTLSPIHAMAAAGIGAAFADLLGGYVLYIPATLVIKAGMAACACFLSRALKKITVPAPVAIALSAIFAELCMTIGYLAYEWTVLRYGAAALSNIPANLIQGAFGCVGGVLFYYIVKHTKLTDTIPAI